MQVFNVRIAKQRLGSWGRVAKWYGTFSRAAYSRMGTEDKFKPSLRMVRAVEAKLLPPVMRMARPVLHAVSFTVKALIVTAYQLPGLNLCARRRGRLCLW